MSCYVKHAPILRVIMKKTITLALTTAAALLLLAGCTGEPTPAPTEPSGEITVVADTYEAAIDDVFNRGKTVEEIEQLNIDYILALGDLGNDYEAGAAVLAETVPTTYIYFADTEPITQITQLSSVLNFMLMNTINDTLTADVDTSAVTIDQATNTATIDRAGITFSSENDDSTHLATALNESNKASDSQVILHRVDDGWKVDMTTLVPNTDVTAG